MCTICWIAIQPPAWVWCLSGSMPDHCARKGLAMMYTATPDSIRTHQAPGWFNDAKLGIFVHWGLYSVPGWAPHNDNLHDAVEHEGWSTWFARNPYAEWYSNS